MQLILFLHINVQISTEFCLFLFSLFNTDSRIPILNDRMDPKTCCIPSLPFCDFPVTTSRLEQFALHSQFKFDLNPNSIFFLPSLPSFHISDIPSALSVPDWHIREFLHLLLIRCHLGSSAQLFCGAPFPVLSLVVSHKPA